ncbi:MAG: hypothetical protein IPO21_15615 [Bacteroidales bacterium]|nr:hypothetical protein [Bacteroidales bacterium]
MDMLGSDGRGEGSFPQAFKTGIQVEGKEVVEILVDKYSNVIVSHNSRQRSPPPPTKSHLKQHKKQLREQNSPQPSLMLLAKGYITYILICKLLSNRFSKKNP